MSIARATARVLRQQLRAHVAWLPLTNNFDLGDFGVFSGGVFVRMGNVASLGVHFDRVRSGGEAFEFRSAGTRQVRMSAGLAVDSFRSHDDDAAVRISFSAADALYIHTAALQVSEIAELLPVASALRANPQWRPRYRVVHRLWTAVDAVFLTSRSSDASIDLTGEVAALESLQAGRASADLHVGASTDVGLELVGHTGPLALGLFRVRRIDGSPALLNFSTTDPTTDLLEVDDPGDDDPNDDV